MVAKAYFQANINVRNQLYVTRTAGASNNSSTNTCIGSAIN